MTGIVFKLFLNFDENISWSFSFTFSAIISATDPVAVVALLKELGTPLRFNILLEGESLLNDGSAMVFFYMFANLLKGGSFNPIEILINFIWLTVGGVILGAIMTYIILFWIKKIVKDDILTINLTFISCYLTFFLSEFYFEVSGIISLVTLGVLMGKFGKVNIHSETEVHLHSVWTFI